MEEETMHENQGFSEWAIVELMGHRRLAGHVSEQTIAGAGLLRLDVYIGDAKEPNATQYYAPSAVYCVTPTKEEIARAFAKDHHPAPVTRWELPCSNTRLEYERAARSTIESGRTCAACGEVSEECACESDDEETDEEHESATGQCVSCNQALDDCECD